MDLPKKLTPEQIDTFVHMYWQLLRSFEEKVGHSDNVSDGLTIKDGYKVWNSTTKSDLKPTYIK